MRNLYRSIATVFILFICATAHEAVAQQKGDWTLGARCSYYTHTGGQTHFAVGAYVRCTPVNRLRIEPSVMVIFGPKSSVDLSAELHYTIPLSKKRDKFWLYPIVGVGTNELSRWSVSVNFGAGFDWFITHHWVFTGSFRYMLQTADHYYVKNPIVPQVSVGYKF